MRENRKSLTGRVVSDKMQKTVVVKVEVRKPHPLYHRIVRHTSRYKAHDEHGTATLGDLVRIEEARPMSREKRWIVAEILEKRQVAEVQPVQISV
jgi:small subunit ribosomal protein S17